MLALVPLLVTASPDLETRELAVSAIARDTHAPIRMRVKLLQPKD